MMNVFALNALSAGGQCHTDEEIKNVMTSLLEAIDFMWPAVQAERMKLVYDASIENNQLVQGESFPASIGRMRRFSDDGPDLAKKWYIYTRQRAIDVTDEGLEVELECCANSFDRFDGTVSSSCVTDASHWLSLGSWPVGIATRYRITTTAGAILKDNAHDAAGIRRLIPNFEPSPKHRTESYWDSDRNEQVAAMPLDRGTAQKVLLTGVLCGGDIFGKHESTNDLYRFIKTGGNTYHGFQVDKSDVPNECRRQLGV
jgi:hypothetical protein